MVPQEMWYVVEEYSPRRFEDLITTKVINSEYFNDHHGEVHHILGAKIIFFKPNFLLHFNNGLKAMRIIRKTTSLSSMFGDLTRRILFRIKCGQSM